MASLILEQKHLMMKNFLKNFIFIFIPLFGFSQNTTTISGYVKGKSEEPLKGVNIYLEKTQLGALTDSLGYFKISNVKPSNYNITA